MSCQLFMTQTSPDGLTARSVCICRPPPTYPPGGEIWSPVLKPGGQFSVRTPHSCVIGLFGIAKLEIQTLSLPSTTTAHGPGRPPAVNGEPGYCEPSGRSNDTLPPSDAVCRDIARVRSGSGLPPVSAFSSNSAIRMARLHELPNRLVTQTLPWLSMLRPLPLQPVSNFSAFEGSEAGNRVTCRRSPLLTQMRFC